MLTTSTEKLLIMDGKYMFFVIISVFCLVWQVQCAVNCTATGPGKFPDPDDTECKNYTYCVTYVANPPGYVSYNYTCPTTSLFNPQTAKCTTNYLCNRTTTSTSTSSTLCKSEGRIPDPYSTDCSMFIECVNVNGMFIETKAKCTTSTYYNPSNTLCESNYTCPTSFTCKTPGRFPNASNKECKSYYFCTQLSDGSYSKDEYTCPSISVFNPTSQLCTTSYTCPTL